MFGDLIELATTVVNPDHSPDIKPHISGASNAKMAGSRRSKSQSVSSTADANGNMPPPVTPASALTKPARKPRSRSTTSPPGSLRPFDVVPSKSAQTTSARGIGNYIATLAMSITVEGVVHSVSSQFLGTGELAAISRVPESWVEIVALLVYKVALLSFYWFSGFDAFDVLSLTLLITTPTTILLSLFYAISPVTLILTTGSMIISHALPYLIFRSVSPVHKSSTRTSTLRMRNRSILTDPYTTLATSILATTIFAVLLELSFATFLPSFLITHFTGIRTLDPAHASSAGLPTLLVALLPAGWACMEFLFAPSTAASYSLHTAPALEFDSIRSGFWDHVYRNLWGWYSVRQKELIWRAAVLGALVMTETVVYLVGVLQGVTLVGALGYAGVWGGGVTVLAAVLDWVGGPSD